MQEDSNKKKNKKSEEEPDYNYYEQVVVRDWETGEEIERFNGQLHRMPNGDIWRM